MLKTTFMISVDHPSLDGHFPGNPISPGVVVLEKVLSIISDELFMPVKSISKAKFVKSLLPGVESELIVEEAVSGGFNFTVFQSEEVIVRGVVQ